MNVREAAPDDYDRIVAVIDGWWGRPLAGALPRLFLDHFWRTSLVAETSNADLAGFLVGFVSPSKPGHAYIHFVGVAPDTRGSGLGRTLYERFFAIARDAGCHTVGAITSHVNTASSDFHAAMGFAVKGPIDDYDGPGTRMFRFDRAL